VKHRRPTAKQAASDGGVVAPDRSWKSEIAGTTPGDPLLARAELPARPMSAAADKASAATTVAATGSRKRDT